MTLNDVIGQGPNQILWWQMCIRVIILFTYGFAMVRIFGLRAFGRLNALDIVLSIIIGSSISRAMTGNAAFVPTIISTAMLFIGYWLVDHIAARSSLVGWLVKGGAVELARDGRLNERNMGWLAINRSDIEEAARSSGIARLEEMEAAMFEKNGKISALRKNP